jgi:signal transduction histidine kinase
MLNISVNESGCGPMKSISKFLRRIKVRIALTFSLLFLIFAIPAIIYAFNQINIFFEGMYLQQMNVAGQAVSAFYDSRIDNDSLTTEISRITATTVFLLDKDAAILSRHYEDPVGDSSFLLSIPIAQFEAGISDKVHHKFITIGKERFLQVQTELINGEKLIQVKSFSRVSALKARMREVIFWSSFLGLLALIAVAFWVSANFTKPLEKLTELAQKLRVGDSAQKIQIKSPDEIGDLADALNDMVDNLNKAKFDLDRITKNQRDFFGQMGDRLESPLLTIQNQLGSVVDSVSLVEPKCKERLSAAMYQVKKVQEVIRILVEISQLEHGEIKLEMKPVGLKKLLETVMASFNEEALHKGLSFKLDLEPVDLQVLADEKWLQIALENLISNALYFTDEGFVKTSAVMIGSVVALRIEDSGRGIPQAQIERIFDRFYRVDSNDPQNKAGLGLVLTREIVRAHQQNLEVESKLGVGSIFTFHLIKADIVS